eukprot:GEMP01030672.1.p1 GENE.GEMP01030672.1~~GEMP01030672.1.p1  ORF type:complete len:176 (+),score=31.58 GEMP01030672.1:184-711(+)
MANSPKIVLPTSTHRRFHELTDDDALDSPMAGSPTSPMPRATVVRDGSPRNAPVGGPSTKAILAGTKLVVGQPFLVLHLCIMRFFQDKDEPGNSVVRHLRKNEIVYFLARGENNRIHVRSKDGLRGWVSSVHSSGIHILGILDEPKKVKERDVGFLISALGDSPDSSPVKSCKQD